MTPQREKLAFLHIPKTGGRALERLLSQLHPDPEWYFDFFGLDSSMGANKVLVESMQSGDDEHQRVTSSPHFQRASMIAGHFSANLDTLFPDYAFRYLTILRDPVERVISNIRQYTAPASRQGGARFAQRPVPDPDTQSAAYWSAIGGMLRDASSGRLFGLMPHESMMLTNGMCRMISGTPLHRFTGEVNVRTALERARTMELAWFSDFNATVTRALGALGIPLTLDAHTNPSGEGVPATHMNHHASYGCPEDVRNLIAHMNQADLELYRTLSPR